MDGLSLDSLLNFVKDFKSQLFVEGLVQGNVTSTVSGCGWKGKRTSSNEYTVLSLQGRFSFCFFKKKSHKYDFYTLNFLNTFKTGKMISCAR